MKIVHKSSILEASEFDPLLSPWPPGIARVTRETANVRDVSYEFIDPIRSEAKKYPRPTLIRAGDLIMHEYDENTLEEIGRHVLAKQLVENEYVILGEVQPQ